MDINEKFLDFKMLAFFRVMILALALLMFFGPWTVSVHDYVLGGIGSFNPPEVRASGFDYLIGCEPIIENSEYVQTMYLALVPIFLIITLILALKPRENFILGSFLFSILPVIPIYHWVGEIQYLAKIPYRDIHITYGVDMMFVFIAINIFLGLLVWRYCELEEPADSQP